ncbi:hypothetical protein ACQYWY_19380 [Comamonas sediminis]|uniref:hypothetical protein n=1 Tax=Comamonas sediminis TaxID=1783360 RepID=UPI003D27DCD0
MTLCMIGAFLPYLRYLQHAISYIKRCKLNNKYRYLIFIGWWLLAKVFQADVNPKPHILFAWQHMPASYKCWQGLRWRLALCFGGDLHASIDG